MCVNVMGVCMCGCMHVCPLLLSDIPISYIYCIVTYIAM